MSNESAFRWSMGIFRGLLFAALLAGCQSESSVPSPAHVVEEVSEGAPATSQSNSALLPMPGPNISQLEEALQLQIQDSRARLERAQASGNPLQQGQAWGELGKLYHSCDLRDAAEVCYLNGEALSPQDFRWPYYLGHLYQTRGQPEKAIQRFEQALQHMSEGEQVRESVAALYWSGEAQLAQNNLAAAQQLYSKALELNEKSAAAMVGLGRIAATQGDSATAVTYLEQALALVPEAAGIHYRLAMEYRKLGDLTKTQQHLSHVGSAGGIQTELAPADPLMDELRALISSARIFLQRGNFAFQAGRFEEAAQEYRQALEADPEDPVTRSNLAGALAMLGGGDAAILQYGEALRLDPLNVTAHFGMGVLSAQRGRDEEAVKHYLVVVEVNSEHRQAQFNLANALSRLGRHQEALPHYGRVSQLDPGNGMARIGEAMTLIQTQQHGQALIRLQEGLDVLPENMEIKNILARLLAASPQDTIRDGPRSLELAQLVFAADANVEHAQTLTMAYAEVGQFDKAIELQQDAIRAAEEADRPELVLRFRKNLTLYLKREPCRTPWPQDYSFASPAMQP